MQKLLLFVLQTNIPHGHNIFLAWQYQTCPSVAIILSFNVVQPNFAVTKVQRYQKLFRYIRYLLLQQGYKSALGNWQSGSRNNIWYKKCKHYAEWSSRQCLCTRECFLIQYFQSSGASTSTFSVSWPCLWRSLRWFTSKFHYLFKHILNQLFYVTTVLPQKWSQEFAFNT